MSSTLSNFRYLEAMAIYLDNNATTPLAPEVVSAIRQACEDAWANPSSGYKRGREAKAQYIFYDSKSCSFSLMYTHAILSFPRSFLAVNHRSNKN